MEEKIHKQRERQGLNFQNIQTAHTSQQQNTQSKKWSEELNRYFSKDNIQLAKRHMKRTSTSLIIREMQIKTTMRYHLTPIRMVITKKSTKNKLWRDCGANRTLLHYWWNCKLVHYGKQYGGSSEN